MANNSKYYHYSNIPSPLKYTQSPNGTPLPIDYIQRFNLIDGQLKNIEKRLNDLGAIVANPEEEATEKLNKVKIGETVY